MKINFDELFRSSEHFGERHAQRESMLRFEASGYPLLEMQTGREINS
jgi:hypothetical protein